MGYPWGGPFHLEMEQPNLKHTQYCQKITTAAQRISARIRFTKEYEQSDIETPVYHAKTMPARSTLIMNTFTNV